MIEFRPLKASEVECRIGTCSEKGCSLLLYKDARCDANILDETVGPEGWQDEFYECKGTLFCKVGIYVEVGDYHEWVYKDDAGAPSNMEPEKGEASDAFKRACFKWGIGRELYTAPFIWVPKESLQKHSHNDRRGKWECRDQFHVDTIEVQDGRITNLKIANQHGFIVYQTGSKAAKGQKPNADTGKPANAPQKGSQRFEKVKRLKAQAIEAGVKEDGIESWIKTTFKGKPKKDMNDNEIKMTEAYLAGLIRDMAELESAAAEGMNPNA